MIILAGGVQDVWLNYVVGKRHQPSNNPNVTQTWQKYHFFHKLYFKIKKEKQIYNLSGSSQNNVITFANPVDVPGVQGAEKWGRWGRIFPNKAKSHGQKTTYKTDRQTNIERQL